MSGTWQFKSPYWKKHMPQGLQFEFGLGTAAATTLVATLATLGILDYLGLVDVKELYAAIADALPAKEGEGGGGTTAADWLNALVPITALDNLLRGKKA